ncbi:hypothetical protein V8G54_020635 [Vigna mungo]|uniref:Uncharacterized protein n=1 Tax=Vigna mungo TaxID=3915 RepID=A0AAQ3NC66_VIGMU
MFLNFLPSPLLLLSSVDGNILFTLSGHQNMTSLFSFENKNLLHAAPQAITVFCPKIEVLNTLEEYFAMRSYMNFSGFPFHHNDINSMLSPTTGNPIFPGGKLDTED